MVAGLVATSCAPSISAPSETAAERPTTTTSVPISTSTTIQANEAVGRIGLYDVDPRSLEPTETAAITTGDWITGTSSKNGDWLALSVWVDTNPDTDLIQIVDVPGRTVVAETGVLVPTTPVITDSGVAYWTDGNMAPFLRLYRLMAGDEEAELVFNDFPVGFEAWTEVAVVDSDRLGWFGRFGPQVEESGDALVVLDLATLSTTSYPVPGVNVGGDEVDFGGNVIFEYYQPEVAWDGDRNLAYVVHSDRDAFTIVELEAGDTTTRTWGDESSWLSRLFAWLIPPAQAKGPSLGTTRRVALTPGGETLLVGTATSHIETEEDTRLSAVWTPTGVVALDTESGAIQHSWSIPASTVHVSPRGDYLIATGITSRDSWGTGSAVNEGVFIIRMDPGDVVAHLPQADENGGQIQFSAEGNLAYLTNYEGRIEVVDLESGVVITEIRGAQELTLFGPAGLMATRN
jgi:hypothetical protein